MEEIKKEEEKKVEFEKKYEGKTLSLHFTRDKEYPKKKNWVTFLPDGKNVLLDKSQLGKYDVIEGAEYTVLVHKELERVAFVKIISKTFEHRVVVKEDGSCIVVTQKNKVERIMKSNIVEAMNYLKQKGVSIFQVILHGVGEKEIGSGNTEW